MSLLNTLVSHVHLTRGDRCRNEKVHFACILHKGSLTRDKWWEKGANSN